MSETYNKAQVSQLIAANKEAAESQMARLEANWKAEQVRLNEEIKVRDTEIEGLKASLAQLNAMSELRANLYALSDTFHIAAKRIAETEDPAEEAKTLKILADQLLTVVGLPPRDPAEF